MLGLRDVQQLSTNVVITSPLAQFIISHMNGEHDIAAIVERGVQQARGHNVPDQAVQQIRPEPVQQLVAQLDHAGLLAGPNFDQMVETMRREFEESDVLPPSVTADFVDGLTKSRKGQDVTREQIDAEGPDILRAAIDDWIKKALEPAQDPSFDALPKAIIVPCIDYVRAWINYAHAYGRMRVVDPPDRVIVLGSNHFGAGTGVVGCDKGFASPLGTSDGDTEFSAILKRHLGEENARRLFEHAIDHEREYAVEWQLPWIHHVFGGEAGKRPKIFAALIHDPLQANGDSYDGKGLALQPFIEALRKSIAEAPGKTLIIASVDLSHAGKSYGDRQPVVGDEPEAQQRRQQIAQHDQSLLKLVAQNKPDELMASLAWSQNPMRWTAVGPLVATLKVCGEGARVENLNYAAAVDGQGMAFVTTFAGAVT